MSRPLLTCGLLPYAVVSGPVNMAADEILLERAQRGQAAALRFYGWSPATLSLGYFQPARVRLEDPLLASLPYVRRASGGMTLVHHHEITYALALPPGAPWQRGESWLCRMHQISAAALAELGVEARLYQPRAGDHFDGPLCFRHFTSGDLMLGTAKVVGSAQRKVRGALVQHGGILLAGSPSAPILPGICELSGRSLDQRELLSAVQRHFQAMTGAVLVPEDWSEEERRRIEELTASKYTRPEWNDRR